MFIYMKSKFFCFREYLITDSFRCKAEYISACFTLHMFMMMCFAAFYLIFVTRFSEMYSPEYSDLSKEFQGSKYTRSSNMRKTLFYISRAKQMLFLHPRKELNTLWSDLLLMRFQTILYIHKWDLVSIKSHYSMDYFWNANLLLNFFYNSSS